MNSYTFHDEKENVFFTINTGAIFHQFDVKQEYHQGLLTFLSDMATIMLYTDLPGMVNFRIDETETSFCIDFTWSSPTKKAKTILYFLELAKTNGSIYYQPSSWELEVIKYINRLESYCDELDFTEKRLDNKTSQAKMHASANFGVLYSTKKPRKKPNLKQPNETKKISVPYELIESCVSSTIKEASKYLGEDHNELIKVLDPLVDKEFLANFLIGLSYLQNNDNENAYAYLKSAVNLMKVKHADWAGFLFNVIGNIEFHSDKHGKQVEQTLINSMLFGCQESFLKLAYLYLNQAMLEKKEDAVNFAKIGKNILPFDTDTSHRLAGYHIVASVSLWNYDFEEAQAAHNQFLNDTEWCENNLNIVEPYFLFAIALGNKNFIESIIVNYPIILPKFSLLIETWQYAILNPYDERFRMEMIPVINRINQTKQLYNIR
ncbi:MAG: hypothetical protein WCQ41_08165 [Bacillota bacterium]